jgi:hypothetical protein
MVGKTNEEHLPRLDAKKDDANWAMMREVYPEFATLRIPLHDPLAIRLAADIMAGLAADLLAMTHRSAGLDQHAAVSRSFARIKLANARIRNRPPRMKTRDYVYGERDENHRVVHIRKAKEQ